MMGAATAMLVGASAGKAAPAVPGDTPAAAEAMDFLDVLGAAAPGDAPIAGDLLPSPTPVDDATAGDGAAVELAALLAAMLQTATPAGDVSEAMTLEAGETTSGSDAPALSAGAAKAAALLQLRTAAATLASASETDDALVGPLESPLENGATSAATPAGLRQLLQMLAPHAGSSDAGASRASPAERIAQSQPSYAAPAELMRRAAELATTPTAANGAQSPELLAAQVQPSSVTTDATITPTPANLAAPAQQTQSAPAGAQPVLQAPVGTPRWADELGSRLVLMSMRGQHEGSLSLTPEHLGPLEVRVSVSQNTANVWFGSQHADTRAALAEAMPRLRELMAGAGLTLGETGVSQHAPRQGSREGEPARISGARAGDVIEGLESASRPVARRIALGLVDTYA